MIKAQEKDLTPALENYMAIIFQQEFNYGACRASDIADLAKVTRASVTSALKALAALGYITYSPYKLINLTEKGVEAGQKLAHCKIVLKDFFQNILHLPEDSAEKNACELEHSISADALLQLRKFVLYLHNKPEILESWEKDYHDLRDTLVPYHNLTAREELSPVVRLRTRLLEKTARSATEE